MVTFVERFHYFKIAFWFLRFHWPIPITMYHHKIMWHSSLYITFWPVFFFFERIRLMYAAHVNPSFFENILWKIEILFSIFNNFFSKNSNVPWAHFSKFLFETTFLPARKVLFKFLNCFWPGIKFFFPSLLLLFGDKKKYIYIYLYYYLRGFFCLDRFFLKNTPTPLELSRDNYLPFLKASLNFLD